MRYGGGVNPKYMASPDKGKQKAATTAPINPEATDEEKEEKKKGSRKGKSPEKEEEVKKAKGQRGGGKSKGKEEEKVDDIYAQLYAKFNPKLEWIRKTKLKPNGIALHFNTFSPLLLSLIQVR